MKNKSPITQIWTPLKTQDVSEEIMKAVKAVFEQVPQIPLSVKKILDIDSDEDCSVDKLVELVSTDPVLVSNILSIVNSSYYGLQRRTDNLRLAVVLLGFKEVKRVAVKTHLSQFFLKGQMKGYSTHDLWEHSYCVSICSENLLGGDDPQKKGVLLTLGLLHDIGKFALFTIGMMMKKMHFITKGLDGISPDAYLLEREERLFGLNHAIVGGLLARKWNLSERTAVVLEHHHYPSFFGKNELPHEFEEETIAVCVSDLIVNRLMKTAVVPPIPHPSFFEEIGLAPSLDDNLTPELQKKIQTARDFIRNIN